MILTSLLAIISIAVSEPYYSWQNEYEGTEAGTLVIWNFDENLVSNPNHWLNNADSSAEPYAIPYGNTYLEETGGVFGSGYFVNVGSSYSGDYCNFTVMRRAI